MVGSSCIAYQNKITKCQLNSKKTACQYFHLYRNGETLKTGSKGKTVHYYTGVHFSWHVCLSNEKILLLSTICKNNHSILCTVSVHLCFGKPPSPQPHLQLLSTPFAFSEPDDHTCLHKFLPITKKFALLFRHFCLL